MRRCSIMTALAVALLAAGCSCDEVDERDGGSVVGPDAARVDASTIVPVPGGGDCAWETGERPTAELPPTHENEHVLELERWGIDGGGGGDPAENRQRMNEAIAWAAGEGGFDRIVVPAGEYVVGEPTNDAYAAGIEVPGGITLELADGAVLRMAPNDRWNYCLVDVQGDDVTIRGGELVGDRADHDFAGGGAHDEGHGICVWTSRNRVLIEDVEIHEMTGDGVLIVGRRASDDGTAELPTTHVTIRRAELHHNRRQGVSIVGGHHVVVEDNHIHHIEGTAPQFGIDIEGAGRTDRDILIYRNRFHHNAGGDVVTSTGRNVWIEENTMIQCQVDADGRYDPSVECDLAEQVDGPIIHWKETDNVILNNTIRMSIRTVNGFWGILGYTRNDGPVRENPVGNLIVGNALYGAGIHMAHNARYVVRDNVLAEGMILGYRLACVRLSDNRIDRTQREHYKLRDVAGVAGPNLLNREEGAPPEADETLYFPMADDAPYRNSSPVFW